MLPDNFGALLVFIGSNAFVGILVSKVLEHQKFFQELSAQAKTNFVMVVHLVLGLVSFFLVSTVSPEFIAQVQPVYAIIASIISQYLVGTEYHDRVIDKREQEKALTEVSLNVQTQIPSYYGASSATSSTSSGATTGNTNTTASPTTQTATNTPATGNPLVNTPPNETDANG